jgi:hypothetical protein
MKIPEKIDRHALRELLDEMVAKLNRRALTLIGFVPGYGQPAETMAKFVRAIG